MLRVDQAVDRLEAGDAGADEDRRDDEVAGALLGPKERSRNAIQRHRGQRVAEVVDQVGEQRDAAGREEDAACSSAVTAERRG